jgi:hypothetical protein
MLDEDKKDDPSQIARWGTDEERREFRRGVEGSLAARLTMRRQAADALKPGPVEMPHDAGFVSCSGDRFPEIPDVVSSARALLAAANLEKLKENSNKPFMMRLLKKKSFGLDSPFMRLALNPDVVATASRYLGVVPILQFVNVYFSSASDEDLSKSQLYHCDSDDVEQVKVWVLCDAVTPESGPLTLLPPAESDLVRKKAGYRYDTLLQDEQVSEILGGRDKEQQFIGPAGTVGFIDTSRCLHFGSRFIDPTTTRLIFMAHYVTPMSFILPPQYWEHARYRELGATPDLDDVSRMVLGTV